MLTNACSFGVDQRTMRCVKTLSWVERRGATNITFCIVVWHRFGYDEAVSIVIVVARLSIMGIFDDKGFQTS